MQHKATRVLPPPPRPVFSLNVCLVRLLPLSLFLSLFHALLLHLWDHLFLVSAFVFFFCSAMKPPLPSPLPFLSSHFGPSQGAPVTILLYSSSRRKKLATKTTTVRYSASSTLTTNSLPPPLHVLHVRGPPPPILTQHLLPFSPPPHPPPTSPTSSSYQKAFSPLPACDAHGFGVVPACVVELQKIK